MSLSTSRQMALDIADRLTSVEPSTVTRYFAGAAIRIGGAQIGFVMKNSLYFRVDDESRPQFEALESRPFSYKTSARNVLVASYYEVPADVLDDDDRLNDWATAAYRAARSSPDNKQKKAAGAAS